MIKFSQADSLQEKEIEHPFEYGKMFEVEESRLKIAVDKEQINLLLKLNKSARPQPYIF